MGYSNIKLYKKEDTKSKYIVIKTQKGILRIPVGRVFYVESCGHAMVLHTDDNSFRFYCTLTEMENLLADTDIVRCHRAFLVNVNKILTIDNNEVVLADGRTIPVSRKEKSGLLRCLLS